MNDRGLWTRNKLTLKANETKTAIFKQPNTHSM